MVKALLGQRGMRSAAAEVATAVAAARGRVVTGLGAGHSRHRSTPERLRRRLAVVIAATVLLGITATIILLGQHDTVQSVRNSSSPAYLDVIELRAALSDADSAAWQSFASGEVQLTLGTQYQNDITNASQDLQQLVALSSGPAGQHLQEISPELAIYQTLVVNAITFYRAHKTSVLWNVYLNEASHSMRNSGGPLYIAYGQTGRDHVTIDGQLSSPWADPALLLVVALAGFLALGSIIVTQGYLRHRFQRTISLPLVVAAALACGLMAWMAFVILPADAHFAAARETDLPGLTQAWNAQICAVDAEATELHTHPRRLLCTPASGLDVTKTHSASEVLNADLAGAANTWGLPIGIPALAAAIATFAWLGIRPRLDEYRG